MLAFLLASFPCLATTDVRFTLQGAPFNQNPFASRIIRLQPIQPFIGSYLYLTSDVTGVCYLSNSPAQTYNGMILAPPSSVTFSTTVTATNLGTIDATVSIPANGLQTIPTGMAAWSIYESDKRYAFNTNANGQAPLSATQSTNLVASAIPTNFWFSSLYSWITNLTQTAGLNTNVYVPGTLLTATTNANAITFNVNSNGLATIDLVTTTSNALSSSAGVSKATVTNIGSSLIGLSNANFTSITYSNPATYINTNTLPGLTNAFATRTELTSGTNNVLLIATNTYSVSNNGVANNLGLFGVDTFYSTARFTNSITGGSMNLSIQTGDPVGILQFQVGPSQAANIGSNYVQSQYFSGNGGGNGTLAPLTNTWASNIISGGLVQVTNAAGQVVTNLVPTLIVNGSNSIYGNATNSAQLNALTSILSASNSIYGNATNGAQGNTLSSILSASNSIYGNATNGAQGNTLSAILSASNSIFVNTTNNINKFYYPLTNGTGIGGTLSNAPFLAMTNTVIGTYPVITQSTNLVGFISSGTTSLTNGLFVWQVGANNYTNSGTGNWITNNGVNWLCKNSSGTTLFSNPTLTGSWTLVGGTGAAVSDYGAYLRGDGVFISGVINATNIAGGFILAAGGTGTTNTLFSPTLTFVTANFGTNNVMNGSATYSAILSGLKNTNSSASDGNVIAGGEQNTVSGVSAENSIVGGVNNTINTSQRAFIGGGIQNLINTLGDVSTIVGGITNQISIFPGLAQYGFVGGGAGNVISNGQASTIPGGRQNFVSGDYDFASGQNSLVTNSHVFMFSDGTSFNSTTNSQALFSVANGVGINTNNSGTNALRVNGNVDALGFSISGVPISSSGSGSFVMTQGGNATNLVLQSSFASMTNVAVGAATNIVWSTNVIKMYQAGTSAATNGAWEWNITINEYTNRVTGSVITNSGSLWLLQQPIGTTLYSSASLINNAWGAVGGSGTASSCYGYYQIEDGVIHIGIITSTNIQDRINSASNGIVNGAVIASLGGRGTNNSLSNAIIGTNFTIAQTNFSIHAIIDGFNAGTTAANVAYTNAGLLYFGQPTWTNNTAFAVVSNGTPGFWILTNTSDHLIYYQKAVGSGASAYPGQAWTVVSGTAPGFKMAFTNNTQVATFQGNPIGAFQTPILYTSWGTNYAVVSPSGDDTKAIAGGNFPFATLGGALTNTALNPGLIYLMPGSFANSAGAAASEYPGMANGQNIVGSGRAASFVEGDLFLSGDLTATNSLKDFTLHGRILNNSSNLVVDNCHLGSTNLIDVFFDGVTRKTVRNSKLESKWDVMVGQQYSDWYDCRLESIGIDTNNNFTGQHGYVVDSLNQVMRVFGGSVLVSNGPPTITQQFPMWTNACVNITTNATGRLELNGPLLQHDARSVAFWNFSGYTNIEGYYYDQDITTTNAPVLWYITQGTNWSPFYKTNSYTLAQLGTNGFGMWNSNGLAGTNNFFISVNSNGVIQNLRMVFGP